MHPFIEGNKRTALATTMAILNRGGYTLPDSLDTMTFVKEVAMGMHDRESIVAWLRDNSVSIS